MQCKLILPSLKGYPLFPSVESAKHGLPYHAVSRNKASQRYKLFASGEKGLQCYSFGLEIEFVCVFLEYQYCLAIS